MNQQKNILAIFKMSSGHSWRLLDGSSTSALRQWVFVLVFGLIITATAIWWSAERFNYWSSLEERVAAEGSSGTVYNQSAVRSILGDYGDRAVKLEAILNNLVFSKTEEALIEEEIVDEVGASTIEG